MKGLFKPLGYVFIAAAIVFIVIHSSFVTSSPGEDFSRDIFFDLAIPHPPLWTSYVPYLGGLLNFIYQFFSLHGLVGIVITITLAGVGAFFLELESKK